MNSSGGSDGAVDKVLSVLDGLADHERLAEITAATGLPKSTVHRILQSLVARGYATTDGEGGYLPGPRVLALAGRVMGRLDPAKAARPALTALRDRTGFTVHLGLRSGDEVVYADKLAADRPYEMRSRVGQSLHLHSTAIGKAILAALPEEQVRAICARTGLPRLASRTITDLGALLRVLAEVRERGYAVDDEENEPGLRCVAAVVTGGQGEVVGAVSVSALALELGPEAIPGVGAQAVAAAVEISAALGGHA
ncbi:DNA-binding IclR family transcriptional regulator [Allocatelliglobosispora scoriae]|uniref:DNA-binding IclR family transcriptional regulator n=1 Tax=Allocatelliglobosispora scoriae TaxID=643052 RepID=A0A841BSB8_9ACTN|nr:IclR family transcriptional regulator [Allocatelliglobosispora scoriae]MBB5870298.1 DNA-binding IclR family transcriptional regulator [Allocatelliglobosispora scoriae]